MKIVKCSRCNREVYISKDYEGGNCIMWGCNGIMEMKK